MQVRDVLKRKDRRIISIGAESTVAEAISRLVENNIGSLPVTDTEGHLLGVLSERDVLRGIHEQGAEFERKRVADAMTRDPETCNLDDDVDDVMGKMSEFRIAKVPVLCDSKLCGIVSVGDVVRMLYEKVASENQHLMSYIHGTL